jgi:hypothetical protein
VFNVLYVRGEGVSIMRPGDTLLLYVQYTTAKIASRKKLIGSGHRAKNKNNVAADEKIVVDRSTDDVRCEVDGI